MNTSCYAAMGRKMLTSPGVGDMYAFLMITRNTLLESYQQKVHDNTLVTVECRIPQAENPMPAMVIRLEAAHVDIAILLDYMTSDVVLEEPEIRSTAPNIPIDNNCTVVELHFWMAGGSGDFEDEGAESDLLDAIPRTSQRRWETTELERFELGTSDVNRYEGEDGDNADADEEEEASQADNGSTQILEDWEHSRFDLGTSNVDVYEGEDGDNADADGEDKAIASRWWINAECGGQRV